MLCDLLAQNGLGDPKEHLNPEASAFALAIARRVSTERYLDWARGRDTMNGWFGTKIMSHWLPMVNAACDTPGYRIADTLQHLIPDARYIMLKRRDIVGAAVSLTLSSKSEKWQEPAPTDLPVYPEEIHDDLMWLRLCESEWDQIFMDLGIEPLMVYYEDMVSSPSESISSILEHLGAAHKSALKLCPRTSALRNARSTELTAAYLSWLESLHPEAPG
jgi:LPS sulfotransferase NodH